MAGELWHNYLTSKDLYACVFNTAGLVYHIVNDAFETWGTGGNDADDYDITLTETAAGASMHYSGTFPAAITNTGTFRITVFDRVTGTPIDSDIAIAQGEFYWDGAAELTIGLIGTDSGTVNHFYSEGGGSKPDSAPAPVVYVE